MQAKNSPNSRLVTLSNSMTSTVTSLRIPAIKSLSRVEALAVAVAPVEVEAPKEAEALVEAEALEMVEAPAEAEAPAMAEAPAEVTSNLVIARPARTCPISRRTLT